MGDLTVDSSVMTTVSKKAKQASVEFGSEQALPGADGSCFGSDAVASAFAASAAAQQAMIGSLRDDAETLSGFVDTAVATMVETDANLARRVR